MTTIIMMAAFGAGGCVRDGWPSFKDMLAGLVGTRWEWIRHLSTQLARIFGALFCAAGAFLLHGSWEEAAIVGAGILAGFYSDMKHGEAGGNGGTFWSRLSYRLLSGLTSLVPLAAVLAWRCSPWDAAIVAVGLAKPPIWGAAWLIRPDRWWAWLEPTRVGAIAFYACIGASVALTFAF